MEYSNGKAAAAATTLRFNLVYMLFTLDALQTWKVKEKRRESDPISVTRVFSKIGVEKNVLKFFLVRLM